MQLQGIIKHIGKPVTRQGKDGKSYTSLKVLLVVLEGNYSNTYPIDINPKLQDQVDQWFEGQSVTFHINMRGNEYTNKTTNEPDAFLSLSAWKFETAGTPAQQAIKDAVNVPLNGNPADDAGLDLPF
jgi:hypothetical protein